MLVFRELFYYISGKKLFRLRVSTHAVELQNLTGFLVDRTLRTGRFPDALSSTTRAWGCAGFSGPLLRATLCGSAGLDPFSSLVARLWLRFIISRSKDRSAVRKYQNGLGEDLFGRLSYSDIFEMWRSLELLQNINFQRWNSEDEIFTKQPWILL